jgi:hypothetical protein
MSVYVPFDEQRKEDASFTLQTMGIQLCINVGIATLAIAGFNFLRPVCILFNFDTNLLICDVIL